GRGVGHDVAAAERRAVDRTAAEQEVPVHGIRDASLSANGGEAALPVADVDIGNHASAAKIDRRRASGGGVGAAHGQATELLVVEVPVGVVHNESAVALGEAVVVLLGDEVRACAGADADADRVPGRQVRADGRRARKTKARAAGGEHVIGDVNVAVLAVVPAHSSEQRRVGKVATSASTTAA